MQQRRHFVFFSFFLFLFAAGFAVANADSSANTTPTGSFEDVSSVVLVEVPVTVHRKGSPVRDLKKENFEVFALGEKQEILDFESVDLTEPAPAEDNRVVPLSARRHLLLVFDLAFSLPDRLLEARRAAVEILDDLHPTDLVGVATHSSANGVNFIVNFTGDRQQVRLALNTLGKTQPLTDVGEIDPLALFLGESPGYQAVSAVDGGFASLADGELRFALERAFEAEARIGLKRQQAFYHNVAGLARTMADIPGRKHVVILSEGFGAEGLTGARDHQSQVSADRIGASNAVFSSPGVSAGDTHMQGLLNDVIREFKRTGAVVQSVFIGKEIENDLAARSGGAEGLFAMAHDTGGELYENFTDLSVALDQMVEKTGVTYLLTFQLSDVDHDGAFHKLKIKLKDDAEEIPRGARVRHREGFYAPVPYEEMTPTQRRLDTAMVILGDRDGGLLDLAAYAAPSPSPKGKPYVPLLVEIDGESLLGASAEDQAQLELYGYAMDAEGKVHDFIHQNLALDLNRAGERLKERGLKYFGHFDLNPGNYLARIMVRHGKGPYAVQTVPIVVPAFERGDDPIVLPPVFPEIGASAWLLTRETERRRRDDAAYPFVMGTQPYLPAALASLAGDDEAQVLVRGVRLGGDELKLSGVVRDANGVEIDGPELVLDRLLSENEGVHTLSAVLKLAGLEPGDYTLSAEVRNAAGGDESSEVRFRVR